MCSNWDMVPEKERPLGEEMCIAPDHCGYFEEPKQKSSKTPLVFRLPKMSLGYIELCGGAKNGGKAIKENLVAEFDGKKMDSQKFSMNNDFPGPLCVILQRKFTAPVQDKSGHVYLAVFPGENPMQISQVIVA